MRTAALALTALAFCVFGAASALAEKTRTCTTDRFGTRTCRTVIITEKTTHIMGIKTKDYERGLRQGKCMPSPSGACGGG